MAEQDITNKSLDKQITQYFEEAHRSRIEPEMWWLAAEAMLSGHHYYKVNFGTRQVLWDNRIPEGEVRAKLPQCLSRYKNELGRLSSVPLTVSVYPTTTNPDAYHKSRVNKTVLEYYLTDKGMDFHSQWMDFLGYLLAGGTAALFAGWDDFTQDPYVEAVPPWEIYPFPANATNDKDLWGIIRGKMVSKEWIEENLPEAKDEKESDSYSSVVAGYGLYSGRSAMKRGVLVKYAFFKPSAKNPAGRVVIMVGKKIYRDIPELPGKVWPWVIERYTRQNTHWWGMSFVYPLISINKELNRHVSAMIARSQTIAHGGWTFIPADMCDVTRMRKQFGGVIPYIPNPIDPTIHPFNLEPPRAGPELDHTFARMKEELDDASSQHEISRGQAAGRVDSASGIEGLKEEDLRGLSSTAQTLNGVLQKTYCNIIELCRYYWASEEGKTKRIRIAGLNTMPMELVVGPDQLGTDEEVVIQPGPTTPQSRMMMQEELYRQLQMQLITPSEFRKGMFSLGIRIPGLDNQFPEDQRKALAENIIMFGDGQQPGQLQPTLRIEDHQAHMEEHRQFMASIEFSLTASPETLEAFEEHLGVHQSFMMPEGDDSIDRQMEDLDASDIENNIEAAEAQMGEWAGSQPGPPTVSSPAPPPGGNGQQSVPKGLPPGIPNSMTQTRGDRL